MLVTSQKIKERLGLFGLSGDRDLETEFLDIWNSDGQYENATVEVTKDSFVLNTETNAQITTPAYPKFITLSDHSTLTSLTTEIENTGHWSTVTYVRSEADPTSLKITPKTSCLGYANRVAIFGDRSYLITSIGERASDFVEEQCNRKFSTGTYTEEICGRGEDDVYVDNYPIQSISKIEEWNGDSWEEVSFDYRFDSGSGSIVKEDGVWEEGFNNFRVEYTGGYSNIPYALEDLVLEVAALMWNKSGTDPRVSREKIGSFRTEFIEDALPPEIGRRLSYWARKDYV